MFLKTGTTLEILREEGKTPVSSDLLIKKEIWVEKSWFKSLRSLTGILLGPLDLEGEKELMILPISSGVDGEKK